jgi:hypothetical protein
VLLKDWNDRGLWIQIVIWSIVVAASYFYLSFNNPLYPWGVIDEESQTFFSSLLVHKGDPPFYFRQPGFFVVSIGGLIATLLDSNVEDPIGLLNMGRLLSFLVLFFAIVVFIRYFTLRSGAIVTFIATMIFLSWPGTLHWAAHFCISAWLAPVGLLFMLAIWGGISQDRGIKRTILVGLLAGALIAIKISSFYAVAAGLFAFSIGVWDTSKKGAVFGVLGILCGSAVIGYMVLAIPYWDYALHPFFAIVRGVAKGSVYVTQGGVHETLKTHFHQVWYPLGLIPLSGLVIAFATLRNVRGAKEIPCSENKVAWKKLWFFCFFIGAAIFSLKGIATETEDNLVSAFRFSLPVAGLPALMFLEAHNIVKRRGSSALQSVGFLIVVGMLTLWAVKQVEDLDQRLNKKETAVAKSYTEQIQSYILPNDVVGSWSGSIMPLASYWLDADYQYAGGYFAADLMKKFPGDRVFVPLALPTFQKAANQDLFREAETYKKIVCNGAYEEIVSRKGLLTQAISWFGEKILRGRCAAVVNFIVRENFETRYSESNGDSPVRYSGHVVMPQLDSPITVLISPVSFDNGREGNGNISFEEIILSDLSTLYPGRLLQAKRIELAESQYFFFRIRAD